MDAIEQANPSLKGVLPKDYARPALNKQRLNEFIDLIGLGVSASRAACAGLRPDCSDWPEPRWGEFQGDSWGEPDSLLSQIVDIRCDIRNFAPINTNRAVGQVIGRNYKNIGKTIIISFASNSIATRQTPM